VTYAKTRAAYSILSNAGALHDREPVYLMDDLGIGKHLTVAKGVDIGAAIARALDSGGYMIDGSRLVRSSRLPVGSPATVRSAILAEWQKFAHVAFFASPSVECMVDPVSLAPTGGIVLRCAVTMGIGVTMPTAGCFTNALSVA
jgi:hypothetical protein